MKKPVNIAIVYYYCNTMYPSPDPAFLTRKKDYMGSLIFFSQKMKLLLKLL